MKKNILKLMVVTGYILLISCSSSVTLKYDKFGVYSIRESGEWGGITNSWFDRSKIPVYVKVSLSYDDNKVFIRSGSNPDKKAVSINQFVNITEDLSPGDINSVSDSIDNPMSVMTSKHAFLYSKKKQVYIRFHTYLEPEEITMKLHKDFWTQKDNAKKWDKWEKSNIITVKSN